MNSGFRYFPEKLYSKPVKMTNIPAIKAFRMSQPQEIFYSIKDGNWSDITVWETVSGRNGKLPTTNDDVYVRTKVSIDITNAACGNFFVSGQGILTGTNLSVLSVNKNIYSVGLIDFTGVTTNLILLGTDNNITKYTSGTNSTITYGRVGNQNVLNLAYANLTIDGSGTKYPVADLATSNRLDINSGNLELLWYNLSVGGVAQVGIGSGVSPKLSKSAGGSVTFIGPLFITNAASALVDFSVGNPTVEFRGGLTVGTGVSCYTTGSGQITFSTNSQTLNSAIWICDAPVLISGAITVTHSFQSGYYLQLNNTIDGNNAGSTLKNNGVLYLNVATNPMTTLGLFDITTSGNVIGYMRNASFTLPYTTYKGLSIQGTGTKTLLGTTSLETLSIVSGGTLQLSTFDLTVSGTSNIQLGTLLKSGAGNVLFTGQLSFTASASAKVDFSAGNPTVEFRGGLIIQTGAIASYVTGIGQITFSTNNQNVGASYWVCDAPVLISGAITITKINDGSPYYWQLNNTINGNNAISTLDNRGEIRYQSATQPMVTGVLQTNAAANTWLYNKAGNQDVTGGTYRTLTLAGTGVKTLQGNVVVVTLYTLTAPATLALNGFTRT